MNRTLLCLAVLAATPSAAGQETFGTLAVGDGLGYGATVDYPTQAEADTAALNECRARDEGCGIVDRFGERMCFAFAISESAEVLGWAVAHELQQARTGAHQHCVDGGGGRACRVTEAYCNGSSADLVTETTGTPASTPTPTEVVVGARCGEERSTQRDCWLEVPGHSGCYAWFERGDGARYFTPYSGWRFDSHVWEGQCINSLAEGHWILTGDFATAQGPFREGRRHGFWEEQRLADGSTRDAQYVNGRQHGVLRVHDERDSYLEIRWVNGEEQGRTRRSR